jgi:hypothetical protein
MMTVGWQGKIYPSIKVVKSRRKVVGQMQFLKQQLENSPLKPQQMTFAEPEESMTQY